MIKSVGQFLLGLGPLRWMLSGSAIIIILLRPAPGTAAVYEGFGVFPSLIFPSLAPIIFMVLMLDALMTRVLLTAKVGDEQARMRRAMWSDLVVGGILILAWYPYFNHLLGG